jgi:hypothetical protein
MAHFWRGEDFDGLYHSTTLILFASYCINYHFDPLVEPFESLDDAVIIASRLHQSVVGCLYSIFSFLT